MDSDNLEIWKTAIELRELWARIEAAEENRLDRQREMAGALMAAIELFHDSGIDREMIDRLTG